MSDFYTNTYNPDVLSCLANLSNDEVFTPPEIVNKMLDMLPQELFCDPSVTFLDPACKSGVFLREIAKRLLVGLEDEIPDLQERIDNIFRKQLFGIAITEITSLLSRRSVYCSKYPNGKYSVAQFDNAEGNIRFKKIQHVWKGEKCAFCGASKSEYDRDEALETHAYELIHATKPEDIFSMRFDVIIGNPPYQLSDGGAQQSASPIFQLFVEQAKKLNPRYLSMIIPARWYSGGKGLDEFRNVMLCDNRLRAIHDYKSASDCFSGVEIKGGIMYFLWDRDNPGDTRVIEHIGSEIVSDSTRPLLEEGIDVFIRHNDAISILRKVFNKHSDLLDGNSFARLVSSRKPFGLATNFIDFNERSFDGAVKIFANKKTGYISRVKITSHNEWVDVWKILTAYGNNIGTESPDDNLNTIIAPPNTCCTETYLAVGGNSSLNEKSAKNMADYLHTRFVRFLISLRKATQHGVAKVYQFVPQQDFLELWSDEKLYAKYGITEEEQAFIESMIRPMELGGDEDA
jgi:site-specific DNA-methyltransferase (adenine-specific)